MARILSLPEAIAPPKEPPDVYRRSAAPAGAFGAQIGEAMESVGTNVLKVADFYDQAAAEQAYTEFQHGVNNVLYGDPDRPDVPGYMGMTGEEAMKARPDVQRRIDDLMQKSGSGLLTGRSQQRFQHQSRQLQASSFAQMGRHYEQQASVW